MFPSGSMMAAKAPTPGTEVFGKAIFAPRFVACSRVASMFAVAFCFAGAAKADTCGSTNCVSAGGVTWTFTSGGSDGSGGYLVDLSIGTTGAHSGSLSEFGVQFTGASKVTISNTNTGWSSIVSGNCVSSKANFWCVSGSPINVPDGTETFVFDVTGLNGPPTLSDVHALQGQGPLAISTGVEIGPGASVPEPSSGMLGLWGVMALAGLSLFRKFVA